MGRRFGFVVLLALLGVVFASYGCGSSQPPAFPGPRGEGGTAGTGAFGGSGGSGGFAGAAGSGGMGGIGGEAGAGGGGGAAGSGGAAPIECRTNNLCPNCPSSSFAECDDNDDCGPGWICIPTGCKTLEGADINRCQDAPGGACPDCRSGDPSCEACREGYTCESLGLFGQRCVKDDLDVCVDDFDCVAGFSCEAQVCVDRRVPCVDISDCPHGYFCSVGGISDFCARVNRPCLTEADCPDGVPLCADIDGDGNAECAGSPEPSEPDPNACVNSDCRVDMGGPGGVCEVVTSSQSQCGGFGLCLSDDDCLDGFVCALMWADGRTECVKGEPGCLPTSCPLNQVCGSGRGSDEPPSCQAGVGL